MNLLWDLSSTLRLRKYSWSLKGNGCLRHLVILLSHSTAQSNSMHDVKETIRSEPWGT